MLLDAVIDAIAAYAAPDDAKVAAHAEAEAAVAEDEAAAWVAAWAEFLHETVAVLEVEMDAVVALVAAWVALLCLAISG